jgi:hypothetical protein
MAAQEIDEQASSCPIPKIEEAAPECIVELELSCGKEDVDLSSDSGAASTVDLSSDSAASTGSP